LQRRIPVLHITVKSTGDGNGVTFTAEVSETRNRVPAVGVRLTAEIEGQPVYLHPPFDLHAGVVGHPIRFELERPRYGTLVKGCGDATTLYGKVLTVQVRAGKHHASTTWHEQTFDPETDAARHAAIQDIWRRHELALSHLVRPAGE
jgi:hypothetical protein